MDNISLKLNHDDEWSANTGSNVEQITDKCIKYIQTQSDTESMPIDRYY